MAILCQWDRSAVVGLELTEISAWSLPIRYIQAGNRPKPKEVE